jgi:hypothetical protein
MKTALIILPLVFILFYSCKKDVSEHPPENSNTVILKYKGSNYTLLVDEGGWDLDGNLAAMGFSAHTRDYKLTIYLRAWSTQTNKGIGTYGVYSPQIEVGLSSPSIIYNGKQNGIIPGTGLENFGDLFVTEKNDNTIKGTFSFIGEGQDAEEPFSGSFNINIE